MLAFYDAVLFGSGDLFVTARVRNAAIGASSSVFYAPGQNGYLTASVLVSLDADATANGGFFHVLLDRATLTTTVDYFADGAAVTQSWSMLPAACVHNFY